MMEPQGEQAAFELRHWDGSDEGEIVEGKWVELLDVYAGIEDDPRWNYLRQPGIRLVPGDGPESADSARIMIVGEAPGALENGAGKPFVGPSGKVLDQLLSLARLEREQCFVTNVVKYRPAGNRTPSLGESFMARDALRAEWKIIQPLITICIGAVSHRILNPAVQALSNLNQGELWTYPQKSASNPQRYVTSIYHPAFGMRYPKMQIRIEEAWEVLGKMIDECELRIML